MDNRLIGTLLAALSYGALNVAVAAEPATRDPSSPGASEARSGASGVGVRPYESGEKDPGKDEDKGGEASCGAGSCSGDAGGDKSCGDQGGQGDTGGSSDDHGKKKKKKKKK